MIVMLDIPSNQFEGAAKELNGLVVEQLLTPSTRYGLVSARFAIDNGAFSGFERNRFINLLERLEPERSKCRFVTVPDVVASARRTIELFDYWHTRLTPWPLAFVLQDGQEDLEIPWMSINAVFVGGSTEWKMSKSAADCIRAAKAMEKWVHVGRVNTPARFDYFSDLQADSVDGTGLSRYTWMRHALVDSLAAPRLPFELL